MSKSGGKLTVGDLSGKRPPTAAAASSWWRGKSKSETQSAPEMKGYCCGSGCAGCPYMSGAFGSASAS